MPGDDDVMSRHGSQNTDKQYDKADNQNNPDYAQLSIAETQSLKKKNLAAAALIARSTFNLG